MTSKQAVTATARSAGSEAEVPSPPAPGEVRAYATNRAESAAAACAGAAAGGPAGELLRELEQAAASFSALERHAFTHALVGWSSGESARRLGVAPKSAGNALQCARRKLGRSGMSGKRPEPGRAPSTVTARASGTASCHRPV
jgi:DNA-directed RNA polymerase specialized sigma24 family protein